MFSELRNLSGQTGLSQVSLEAQAGKTLDAVCEKKTVHGSPCYEGGNLESSRSPSGRWRPLTLVFLGCCVGLGWLLTDCTPAKDLEELGAHTVSYEHLVKDAVPGISVAPTPSPTSLLEVFQVYQPVLTPQGAVDETTLIDGQDGTSTIASASSSDSCEVLLMEHDFAFSYGMPFVGVYYIVQEYTLGLTFLIRYLYTTQVRVQSSNYEFHCYRERTPIRQACSHVLWRHRSMANLDC